MKKTSFILTAFLISATVSAQGLDFSGTWKLNTSKSKLGAEFSMAPKEIIIAQKGNDFSVEKHSSFQDQEFTTNDKFTLDGKECLNQGWQDSQKKSTAVWSEDKKSLKIISKMSIGDGGEMTITEVYKMDGGNMVIESSSSSSFGEMTETMVYDKQ
ncbi:MAG: hypothetical protein MUO72_15530 [Bacteroidales bacterium]|nr:hypothetical protein [Bacteroidales bacterium]